MNKKEFKIFTRNESKSIPANMFLIKNVHGWLFLTNNEANWFVNHTQDFKDCPPEEDEKAIKAIIKQVKINAAIAKPDEAK